MDYFTYEAHCARAVRDNFVPLTEYHFTLMTQAILYEDLLMLVD